MIQSLMTPREKVYNVTQDQYKDNNYGPSTLRKRVLYKNKIFQQHGNGDEMSGDGTMILPYFPILTHRS